MDKDPNAAGASLSDADGLISPESADKQTAQSQAIISSDNKVIRLVWKNKGQQKVSAEAKVLYKSGDLSWTKVPDVDDLILSVCCDESMWEAK